MAVKSSRKCSICRNPGHTKRTCTKSQASLNSATKKKKNKKGKSVYVKVVNQSAKSPHVIKLENKRKQENDIWDGVAVYGAQNKVNKVKTQTLDWADMIKQANHDMMVEASVSNINKKLKKEKNTAPKVRPNFKKEKVVKNEDKKKFSFASPKISGLSISFNFKRLAYVAVVIMVIAVSSFPATGYIRNLKAAEEQAVEQGTRAFLSLQASTVAAFQSDLNQAETELTNALQAFSQANSFIENDYKVLLTVAKMLPVVGTQVNSRQSLLIAGNHMALGNTYLIKGIETAQADEDMNFSDRLFILQNHLKSASVQYKESLNYLNNVELDTIPLEYQKTFSEFKLLFAVFIDDMENLIDLSSVFNVIFGSDSFKRYLLVFQNESEIRPTGGFMGSFAVLDVQKGKVLNIELPGGGTYDLRGQLTKFVKPPLPFQLLNERWEFQDANWFPDFSASAEKMGWFYENSRGATVDGVIAVNSSVLERVLRVLGPVEADDVVLEQASAVETLQYEVEEGYEDTYEQPKEILSVILDSLLEDVKDVEPSKMMSLLVEAHDALSKKEIQIYIDDENIQNRLRSYGWTGEISQVGPVQDYLNIVNTNIQGQKSDAKIKQNITHEVVVDDNNNIIDTVVVERTHNGEPGEMFYGSSNINYVRVYVPEGSELLEAEGFNFPPEDAFRVPEPWYENDAHLAKYEEEVGTHLESGTTITNEFGKTVFGNWVITPPGETSVFYLRYKLPFKAPISEAPTSNLEKWQSVFIPSANKNTSRYSLFVQKQSGVESDFQTTIIYPTKWFPVWKSNDGIDLASNGAVYDTSLDSDKVIGVAMESDLDKD